MIEKAPALIGYLKTIDRIQTPSPDCERWRIYIRSFNGASSDSSTMGRTTPIGTDKLLLRIYYDDGERKKLEASQCWLAELGLSV